MSHDSGSRAGLPRLELTDYFALPELQITQDALASALGVTCFIVDRDGRLITKPSRGGCSSAGATRDDRRTAIPIRAGGRHLADWVVCGKSAGVTALSERQFGKICQALDAVLRQVFAMAARNLEQTLDIGLLQRVQNELRLQRAYFKGLFTRSPQGIALLDNTGRVIDVNAGFENLFQYRIHEIRGLPVNDLIIPAHLCEEAVAFSQAVIGGQVIERESVRRRKDGSLVDVSILAYPIVIEETQIGLYSIYGDITERKQVEERLRYVSLHDSLTGLYNRAYFEEEIRRLDGGRYAPVSIIVCDVDGLKQVNDVLGHKAGDKLLVSAAGVIKSAFRDKDVVARIGGDEFAVLLPYCPHSAAEKACDRIRANIESYNKNREGPPLSISIGCASGDGFGNMSALFKEADNEMYREKLQRGQTRVRLRGE